MSSTRTIRRVLLCAAIALTLLVSGCGSNGSEDTGAASVQPEAISLEERTALPEGFPIEIPALSATITFAENTGAPDVGPWHYESHSDASRDAVVDWYRDAYTGRSWEVATDTADGTGYDLAFIKGGAWSTVRVTEAAAGCTIECWAGIGVPVPPQAVPPSSQGLDA